MNITVQLFGHYSDLYPEPLSLAVQEDASVQDLIGLLVERDPRLARIGTHCRFAIDAEYVQRDTRLHPDCLVAVLPPMSGG